MLEPLSLHIPGHVPDVEVLISISFIDLRRLMIPSYKRGCQSDQSLVAVEDVSDGLILRRGNLNGPRLFKVAICSPVSQMRTLPIGYCL